MKIGLIMENSQAAKNEIVFDTLKSIVEPLGHETINFGMYGADDPNSLTYIQNGILAAILLNTGVVDFIVTGCGTGEGAMLALNSFPGVICGHVQDPTDAFLFGQINNGNAIAIPYAKGFGWGAELNLGYIFEKLFTGERGQGYPEERAVPIKRNKLILDEVKKLTYKDLLTILKSIDQELLKGAISGANFEDLFFPNCQDAAIAEYLRSVLA